jgi:hypothetical protein
VVARREDDDLFVSDDLNKAIVIIDPPRPRSGQMAFQRLWFADPLERVAKDVLNELIDANEHLAVVLHARGVDLPPVLFNDQSQALPYPASGTSGSINSCSAISMSFGAFS